MKLLSKKAKRAIFLSVGIIAITFNTGFAQDQHKIDSLRQVIADIEKQCTEPCAADTIRMNAYNAWYEEISMQMPDSAQELEFIVEKIALRLLETKLSEQLDKTAKKYLADAIKNIAYFYDTQGNMPKALEYYNKSLNIYNELEYKKGIALSFNKIGLIYDHQGDKTKALEYHNKSLNIYNELEHKIGIAASFNNIGSTYEDQGDMPKALEYYNKSLKIRKEIGAKKGIAQSFNNIGSVYSIQGNIPKALEYFNKSLNIRKEIGDKEGIAMAFNHIGVIYRNQGDMPKTLEYFNKSLNIKKEIGDKEGIAISFNNIGIIYKDQGDMPKALEYYNKSLYIFNELEYKKGIAISFNNIGIIYKDQGDMPKALEYFNKSLNIGKEIGDKKGIATSFNNIGYIYSIQGNIPKALEYYNKSLNIKKEIGDKKGIAVSLYNLGKISLANNNIAELEKYAQKTYKVSKELGSPEKIKNAASLMTALSIKQNNYTMADSFAIEVIDIDNKGILLNFATLAEKGQEKYFKTVAEDYMNFNSYSLIRKQNNPAIVDYVYNNTVRNKGLLLKSSTAMRNVVLNSKDTVLIDNYYKWIHLKKKIAKLNSKGKDATEIEEQANEYEKELVKSSQMFSDFKQLQNMSWRVVQKALKANEVAVEFVHFKLKDMKEFEWTDTIMYCALVVAKNSNHPEMIPLFREKQLEEIIGKSGSNNYNYINSVYGKNTEVNTELYNLIWKPMAESLKGAGKVFISPTGLLHKISFSAIAKEQNIYLCDVYDIEVKSSTGKITENRSASFGGDFKQATATLFGGITYDTDSTESNIWTYLEGTKTETEKIEKILEKKLGKLNYFSNTTATEEEFKKMASNSTILHIATHGFFYPDPAEIQKEIAENVEYGEVSFRGGSRGFGVNSFVKNRNPLMRSGLVFYGANDVWSKQNEGSNDDGVLTAQEVANIDMRKTDLVVMSACETGLGDIKGSEGVYGLQRAFKMAGVDFIIMSLWQVPDKETEEFMTLFYKKLLKQKDIKQAFVTTQTKMRKKYDPYFWAAFVLIE